MKARDITLIVLGAAAGFASAVSYNALSQQKVALDSLLEPRPALEYSAAAGQGRFGKSPDGMWWQSDHDNPSRYKDNRSFELGVAGRITGSYGWSIRYVSLGRAHTRAMARTSVGDDAKNIDRSKDGRRAACQSGFNEDNCEYQWSGDGGPTPGLNFAIDYELVKIGRFSLEPEVGAYVYRMKWSEQVFPMDCTDTACPWRVTVEQKTGYYVSPMAGLTARFSLARNASVFVATRYYLRTSQHVPISAGISGPAQTWLAGITTSF